MASLGRKRTVGGGCARIFQRSIKEMGSVEKQLHICHSKSDHTLNPEHHETLQSNEMSSEKLRLTSSKDSMNLKQSVSQISVSQIESMTETQHASCKEMTQGSLHTLDTDLTCEKQLNLNKDMVTEKQHNIKTQDNQHCLTTEVIHEKDHHIREKTPDKLCPSREITPNKQHFPSREVMEAKHCPSREKTPDKHCPSRVITPDKHHCPSRELKPDKHCPSREKTPDKHHCPSRELTPDRHHCPSRELTPDRHHCPSREITPDKHHCPSREITPDKHCPSREITPDKHHCPSRELTPDKHCPSREITPDKHLCPSRELTPDKQCPSREITPDKHHCPRREITPDKQHYSSGGLTTDKQHCSSREITPDEKRCPSGELTPDKHQHPSREITPEKQVQQTSCKEVKPELLTSKNNNMESIKIEMPEGAKVAHGRTFQTTPIKNNDYQFKPYNNLPKAVTPPRFLKFKEMQEHFNKKKMSSDENNNNMPLTRKQTDFSHRKSPEVDNQKSSDPLNSQLNRTSSHNFSHQYKNRYQQNNSHRETNHNEFQSNHNRPKDYRQRGDHDRIHRGAYGNTQHAQRGTYGNAQRGTYANAQRGTYAYAQRGTSGNTHRGAHANTQSGTSGNTHRGAYANTQRGTFGKTCIGSNKELQYPNNSIQSRNTEYGVSPLVHCNKESGQSEDWSTELLNLSDWNSDNMMEEHINNSEVGSSEKDTWEVEDVNSKVQADDRSSENEKWEEELVNAKVQAADIEIPQPEIKRTYFGPTRENWHIETIEKKEVLYHENQNENFEKIVTEKWIPDTCNYPEKDPSSHGNNGQDLTKAVESISTLEVTVKNRESIEQDGVENRIGNYSEICSIEGLNNTCTDTVDLFVIDKSDCKFRREHIESKVDMNSLQNEYDKRNENLIQTELTENVDHNIIEKEHVESVEGENMEDNVKHSLDAVTSARDSGVTEFNLVESSTSSQINDIEPHNEYINELTLICTDHEQESNEIGYSLEIQKYEGNCVGEIFQMTMAENEEVEKLEIHHQTLFDLVETDHEHENVSVIDEPFETEQEKSEIDTDPLCKTNEIKQVVNNIEGCGKGKICENFRDDLELSDISRNNETSDLGQSYKTFEMSDISECESVKIFPEVFSDSSIESNKESELSSHHVGTDNQDLSALNKQDSQKAVNKYCTQVQTREEFESDVSAHGDIYDTLIKQKVKDIKSDNSCKIGTQTSDIDEALKWLPSHNIIDLPTLEQNKRSHSTLSSPYMQIKELVQHYKHKESERNLLLEEQKQWRCQLDVDDKTSNVNRVPMIGRGIVTVASDPHSLVRQEEDWESDLFLVDQCITSDQSLTEEESTSDVFQVQDHRSACIQREKLLNVGLTEQTVRPKLSPVPVSHSYLTVKKCQAQQTPLPYHVQKPDNYQTQQLSPNLPEIESEGVKKPSYIKSFIPKFARGRGCLSPDFQCNLNKFINVEDKKVLQQGRGFNVKNQFDLQSNEKKDRVNPSNRRENKSPEDWECSLINVDSLDKNQENLYTENLFEKISATDQQIDFNPLIQETCKAPQTIINQNFIDEHLGHLNVECDSASLSSMPQCELLSPKSQSTLSGVPTMSDYENSESGQMDVNKKDIEDEILDGCFTENTTQDDSEKDIKVQNDQHISTHDTGDFVNSNVDGCNKIKEESHSKQNTDENDVDPHYMSYFYPDLSSCNCHPSVQQYWVWHTCMCQIPRLCEIRTCQDYWLQYPFEDMEGIYHTVPIPDVNNNKKSASKDQKQSGDENTILPPGLACPHRKVIYPVGMIPQMPFKGVPPPPPSKQIWDRMHSAPMISHCRMSYRGPQPRPQDVPVHMVQGSHSSRTVISPIVCAQGFYHGLTSPKNNQNTHSKQKYRHKSEMENGEQNDSGVVVEGSPGFIGPILPGDVKLKPSRDKLSPLSAIRTLLGKDKDTPRKRLVDYSYSETEESEDDRSRSSQGEKRLKEGKEDVIQVHDSNSEEENSYRLKTHLRKNHVHSKHLPNRESSQKTKTWSSSHVKTEVQEVENTDDSDDGSSKFQDCSSTISNYQILQTVLNQKFPKNHRTKKAVVDNDLLDLTDDGSEIISVASQESSERDVKPKKHYQKTTFWQSPDSCNDSALTGYSMMFPPYTYPGWVSQEMIAAGYTPPSPNIGNNSHLSNESSRAEFLSRQNAASPADSGISQTPEKYSQSHSHTEENEDSTIKRGSLSMRGMTARMRFLNNSKLMDNEKTFKDRLAMYPKKGRNETDSDSQSQSSWTFNWKIRFMENCRRHHGNYIDSHCHLDFLFTRTEFGGTWSKFKEVNSDTMPPNFEGCVAVFCHPSSFRSDGLWNEIAKEKDVWITFGCHPKNATEFTDRTEINLKFCLMNHKVVALGEIGLDYSGIFEKHKEVQQIVFRKQIQIALDMNKPLVIHCRDAEQDALAILEEMVPKNYKIHCHCFTGNYESAKKWMDMFPNLFIGLTPLVTYKSATSTHEVARFIPLERLLLETDAPYFIPRKCPRKEFPHSHPGMAITVAEEVSYIKRCPISEVLYSCRQNTKLMYGI
ncbi:uncharacterized protein LOC143048260 isoform X2 [Mytilus galloprovincialis]|uniref:uncharacterized protein LOC143048260 isoform X2 n=1 Tax=Mytilus galloprovincialis TaxID=29158 RepID=UPI003F7C04D2